MVNRVPAVEVEIDTRQLCRRQHGKERRREHQQALPADQRPRESRQIFDKEATAPGQAGGRGPPGRRGEENLPVLGKKGVVARGGRVEGRVGQLAPGLQSVSRS